MSADFFLKKGVSRFGYFTPMPDLIWSQEREKGFRARLCEEGVPEDAIFSLYARLNRGGIEFNRSFRKMLKNLPKPISVLAASDQDGQKLIECCSSQYIKVPEEVSVLGIDNDDLLCVSSTPPLSSISIDAEGAGFRAAGILDRMMNDPYDPELKPGIIPLEPIMIHERQSTNMDHFSDPMVVEIFDYLRANTNSAINVSDVVRAIRKSRRVVETRFKAATGETVHDAILRLKLDAVKRFLTDTSMPLQQVAEESGFSDDSYLGQIFRKKFGMTMDSYRRRYRKEYRG
ncbi:MAG: substrate-binding domain-containing protein [Planctomycetia bacterium]|nr:substrate-binding domain-containing protein [Planctomycetia bacterium]